MNKQDPSSILSDWSHEINETLIKSNSLCLAIFSLDGDLLLNNPAFNFLNISEPTKSFINPKFEDLLKLDFSSKLIFDGHLTIAYQNETISTSLVVQIYRKDNQILVIGGVETLELIRQNTQLAELNKDISNLQRQVLRKSHNLENALKELDESNSELKKEQAMRDKLFSIIAHDLRSPFNGILGFSELLLHQADDVSSSESRKYLDSINLSAKNTLVLLDNLLNWSKSQTGQISCNPEMISLSSLIEDIVEINLSAAAIKNIDLNYDPMNNLMVYVDPNIIKTILRNLVSNAIKYTVRNGKVTILASQLPNFIEIVISDTGSGISQESLNNLFERETFQPTPGTAKEMGSGLGLILCKEFVEMIGGKIWAESNGENGSDFKFTLPLKESFE